VRESPPSGALWVVVEAGIVRNNVVIGVVVRAP
jgi:hypothetical protein